MHGLKHLRLALEDLQAVLFEPHVIENRGVKKYKTVRARRKVITRKKFVGGASAAYGLPPFQAEDPEPGLGEIEGGNQPVVAATYGDGVVIHQTPAWPLSRQLAGEARRRPSESTRARVADGSTMPPINAVIVVHEPSQGNFGGGARATTCGRQEARAFR